MLLTLPDMQFAAWSLCYSVLKNELPLSSTSESCLFLDLTQQLIAINQWKTEEISQVFFKKSNKPEMKSEKMEVVIVMWCCLVGGLPEGL